MIADYRRHVVTWFRRHAVASLLLVALQPLNSWGQDTLFTADLQLLSRGEIRNGGMTRDAEDPTSEDQSAFILDRERITLGYQRSWLEAKVAIQHVGTWGHEGASTTSIYEAWGKLTTNNGFFAQIGRQALRYDDERIMGTDDWVMAARSHDALRLGYDSPQSGKYGRHRLHAIVAYNQNLRSVSSPISYYTDGSCPYKTMQTVWYHFDTPRIPLGVSVLLMNIGMQAGRLDGQFQDAPHTEWQLVYGGYMKYAPKHFSIEGSYYRQTGHDENDAKLDAWMAAVKAEWKPNNDYSVSAGFDYLSGDDYVAVVDKGGMGMPFHKENKGFNPVYGSHHKFYGAMDFFYLSTFVNGFTPGLQNAYIGGTYRPLKNLGLKAAYHYLATGTKLEGLNRSLGHEIELEASYSLFKDVHISAGFSYMTGTETMERLKRASGDGSLRWGWLSLNFTPRLFSAKW